MNSTSKLFSFFFFLMISTSMIQAQTTISQEIGLGSYIVTGTGASVYSAIYSPRINFYELSDNMTLSAGTHVAVGGGFNSNSIDGASGYYNLDLPVVLELNFGHNSQPDASGNIGGFIGAGFGINQLGIIGDGSVTSLGPVFNGGVSGVVRDQNLGLRISYLQNINDNGGNVFSVGLLYMIGY